MMRVTHVLVPIAIATTVLAGCGGQADTGNPAPSAVATSSSPTTNGVADLAAEEILTKAIAALKKAGSFQFKGDMVNNGEKMSLDLKVQGDNLLGSITMQETTLHLLSVDGELYFKADESFWQQSVGAEGKVIAQLLGDKWAKISPDDKGFADFFKIADPEELLKSDGTAITKGETKDIDGVPAIALTSSDQSRLYVATEGEPYPLLMEGPDGEGQAVFSGFGSSFDGLTKPAANEFIDFSKLTSGK
jgi:hypothetical protein